MIKFNREINFIIEIIDSVLKEENIESILKNDLLSEDELSSERYLRLFLKKQKTIFLMINISSDGLDISLDKANEAIIIPLKQIKNDPNILKEWIKILFFSRIRIEYFGTHHTHISFFNKFNKDIRHIKYNEGILGLLPIKIGKKEVFEYEPIIKN